MTKKPEADRCSKPSRTCCVALLLISAFSLWLRTGFPVTAIAYARHDDALFVRLARFLESGHWLGPYDNLTLAKGMLYPLFVALSFWTSVPLKIAEQVVYLLASLLTANVVRHYARSDRLSLVLFGFLAFNPVAWDASLARVLRQGLYMSLSLIVVVLFVKMVFPAHPERYGLLTLLSGLWLGLVGAAYWLTREEGLWLVPSLTVVLLVALVTILRPSWLQVAEPTTAPERSSKLKRIAAPLAVALISFTAADFLVAGINYHHYGMFQTNEFRSKSFLRSYGAISRIQHDHWRPFITFPKDARERAYAVSPAARELENSLEGATGKRWLDITCSAIKTKPCDEVEAGWAVWEFRDAVADAGHYRSGAEAMRFYDALARQINSACDKKDIPCLPGRATLLPPFRWEYVKETVTDSKPIIEVMLKMSDGPITAVPPSMGPPEGIAIFADTVDDVYSPDRQSMIVRGWAAAKAAVPALHLVSPSQESSQSSIRILPAPDIFAAYPALKSERFELTTDCKLAQCALELEVAGREASRVPLTQIVHPAANAAVIETPTLMLYVDSVIVPGNSKYTNARRNLQVRIARAIASGYSTVFPALALIALAGLAAALIFRQYFPLPVPLLALGWASLAACVVLTALLSYLTASSDFPVAHPLYTSPASPFVILFTMLGLYAWFSRDRVLLFDRPHDVPS
jgi:hypothetical protein